MRLIHKLPMMPSAISSSPDSPSGHNRLLLVSNRLPITIKRTEDGFDFSMSSGGLVSGLSGLSKYTTFQWYGWPGLEVPEREAGRLTARLKEKYNAVPVYIDDDLANAHYNGFANQVLWPNFHYHLEEMDFNEGTWNAYRETNRVFACAIAAEVQDGDMIWIHDYHLMILPEMLREEIGNNKSHVKIGFFLHTPFPSSEIYRALPVRHELLRAVLHSDLIGFHTWDYARHFLRSCERILGLQYHVAADGVNFAGRFIRVGTYPIGIDPEKWHAGLKTAKVQERIAALAHKFQGMQLIVGVDRLDYIKGVQQKLHAFEVFLTEHPECVGKVVLVQVAVPSRGDVDKYQDLRESVERLVGSINGRFGTFEFTPIHYIYQSVPFDELIALYAASDACLVTSTRDGMNLVSFEYAACQQKRHGVMLLSEFTGAAQSLTGSVVFNPWDAEELARSLHQAVTMSPEEREERYNTLAAYVNHYTSAWWGERFVADLKETSPNGERKTMPRKPFDEIDEPSNGINGAPKARDTMNGAAKSPNATNGTATPPSAANGAAKPPGVTNGAIKLPNNTQAV